jgi:hypothetical protein
LFVWWALPEDAASSDSHPGALEFEKGNVHVRASNGRLRLLDVEVEKERMKGARIFDFFRERGEGILT